MSDLISRQAAIEALSKAIPSLTTPDGTGQFDHEIQVAAETLVDAMQIINDMPSAQQWIPVTEKLPEEERNIYWVYTDFGSMHECRWTNNRFGLGESDTWGWSIFDVPQHSKVTHWRELPEPPKEEET